MLRWLSIYMLFHLGIGLQAQENDLQEKFFKILQVPELKHAAVSCSVLDIRKNELIVGVNQEMSLIPASSLKLITTLSTLNLLGSDFRFTSYVTYTGEILADGTLQGDIIVEGSGDPSLGTTDFNKNKGFPELLADIVKAIQKKGITCVDGNLIADESVFNSFPVNPNWQWNDLGNYYASGAWGINVFQNEYHVFFQQTNTIGATPLIHHYYPEIPGLELQNEIETDSIGTGDNAYIFGGPYNYKKRIVGTIPAGNELFRIKGSIPDPPFFFIYHLQKELDKKGIQSGGLLTQFEDRLRKKKFELFKTESVKLEELIKKANFESNNLYCESFLKRVGFEILEEGSGEMGKKVIRNFLNNNEVPVDGLHLVDGSGLSARNLMSSHVMVRFLSKMIDKMGMKKVLALIPKVGFHGTVSKMLEGKRARGHVWAKSGSMDRVLSYSGIIKAKSENQHVFCFIINGHSAKNSQISKLMQELMSLVYESG